MEADLASAVATFPFVQYRPPQRHQLCLPLIYSCPEMSDPLSAATAVIGLVPISFQAARALRDTIQSFKNHPRQLRGLFDELEDLINVLGELKSIVHAVGEPSFVLLEAPLRRCDAACKEFTKALQDCDRSDQGEFKSTFTGWLKIRWRGSDINEFKDTLAGYKSTIAIAIAGANLRTTRVSLEVLQKYQTMIEDTKADLHEHLSNIDDKLRDGFPEDNDSTNVVEEWDMEAERDCTVRCLEICAQVTRFIEDRHRCLDACSSDSDTTPGHTHAEGRASQQATDATLRGCSVRIRSQHSRLSARLKDLNTRLNSTSGDDVTSTARDQMMQEAETIHQCLEICEQEALAANRARVNVVEDVASAEDSNAVIVSTIGDLIAAHRVTSGARSNMTIGQMSDETVKHLSTVHATRLTELSKSPAEPRTARSTPPSAGRTLGDSNIRTLQNM
ncbi:hypothetical protein CB0940_12194 [Cercospora beticola]|uniref:Azaphilone pigments biosynthesis cluster protein L N-terminal domain-containing protein n=1 Tax=Cercospora beticola TaxID=122368 RepID=A0A2G5GRR0_CERBT|nr:hypothetical protein CB0940_12194 [Cercospora beticola]PIA82978.1 hypothetical protein CB0940_12194 [Cercospora beticola]WPA97811.1 hypothetical protein RHO25_002422 [Cercospora beticola]